VDTRLGAGVEDAEEIKEHPFFRALVWDSVYDRQTEPPFRPPLSSEEDASLFDTRFTKMTPVDSPCETNLSMSINPFEGFTYVAPSVLAEMNDGPPRLIKARSPRKSTGGYHGPPAFGFMHTPLVEEAMDTSNSSNATPRQSESHSTRAPL